jgi:type VI secretion system protein ImpF
MAGTAQVGGTSTEGRRATGRTLGRDRLLPCFLDRLRDDYPKATRESRAFRSVTLRQYRDSVLRDLQWLLNTGLQPPGEDLADFPQVQRSVSNYGVRSLSGVWASSQNAEVVEQSIKQAILDFEPRVLPQTLEVRLVGEDREGTKGGNLVLEISGELYAEPVTERLYLRTEIDLETGQCMLNRA